MLNRHNMRALCQQRQCLAHGFLSVCVYVCVKPVERKGEDLVWCQLVRICCRLSPAAWQPA